MANRLRRMRVISWSTLAILLISVQVACNGKTPTAPSGPAPVSFSIVGDVQDIAWRPVRGAKVELTVGTNAGAFATTDDEGRFTLPVSAPASGSYTLQASKEGLSPQQPKLRCALVQPAEPGHLQAHGGGAASGSRRRAHDGADRRQYVRGLTGAGSQAYLPCVHLVDERAC